MKDDKVLLRTKVKPFEFRELMYLAPQFLFSFIVGLLIGFLAAFVIIEINILIANLFNFSQGIHLLLTALTTLLTSIFALYYFCLRTSTREILVFSDRIILKGIAGQIEISRKEIESVKAIPPIEVINPFIKLLGVIVTFSVTQAVRIERNKLIDYTFSPPNRQNFLNDLASFWGEENIRTQESDSRT